MAALEAKVAELGADSSVAGKSSKSSKRNQRYAPDSAAKINAANSLEGALDERQGGSQYSDAVNNSQNNANAAGGKNFIIKTKKNSIAEDSGDLFAGNYIKVYPQKDAKLPDKYERFQKRAGRLCSAYEKNIFQLIITFADLQTNQPANDFSKQCQHVINMSEVMVLWDHDHSNENFLKSLQFICSQLNGKMRVPSADNLRANESGRYAKRAYLRGSADLRGRADLSGRDEMRGRDDLRGRDEMRGRADLRGRDELSRISFILFILLLSSLPRSVPFNISLRYPSH